MQQQLFLNSIHHQGTILPANVKLNYIIQLNLWAILYSIAFHLLYAVVDQLLWLRKRELFSAIAYM